MTVTGLQKRKKPKVHYVLSFGFLSYPWIIFIINRSATIKQICKYLWYRNVKSYVCQVKGKKKKKNKANNSLSLICRNSFHSHLKWLYLVWRLVMFCDALMGKSRPLTSEGDKHFLLCLFFILSLQGHFKNSLYQLKN